MRRPGNVVIEASLAAGLAVVLLLIIGLDHLLPSGTEQPPPPGGFSEGGPPPKPKPPRMAMTPSTLEKNKPWENMAEVLGDLGEGYKCDQLNITDLFDAEKLAKYDILFFTCGQEENNNLRVRDNLRQFVEKGGTLYASDWRYDCLKLAFHDFADPSLVAHGQTGNVTATVVDPGLRDVFGEKVNLHFNLQLWKAAAFGGRKVEVMLRGTFATMSGPGQPVAAGGGQFEAPLLVRFHHGKGTVIFTSFHNEGANTQLTTKLLKYLVFSVITAKENANVHESLLQGGFSPSKSNLMSASADDPKVVQTYVHKKAGKLRFVLAFGSGARLKLEVEGPGGQKKEQTGDSTFTIEVPDAAAGDWRCTITALHVPYANFPFTMTVAEESK